MAGVRRSEGPLKGGTAVVKFAAGGESSGNFLHCFTYIDRWYCENQPGHDLK